MNISLANIPNQELTKEAVLSLRKYFHEHKLTEKEADVPWQIGQTFVQAIEEYKRDYGIGAWEFQFAAIWGQTIRNFLRQQGFGENYLQVDNLNHYWMSFVKEALL